MRAGYTILMPVNTPEGATRLATIDFHYTKEPRRGGPFAQPEFSETTNETLQELAGSPISLAPPQKHRMTTEKAMRKYLSNEHGIVFIPKTKPVEIPVREYDRYDVYRNFLDATPMKVPNNYQEWVFNELPHHENPGLIKATLGRNKTAFASLDFVFSVTQRLIHAHGYDSHIWIPLSQKLLQMKRLISGTNSPQLDELRAVAEDGLQDGHVGKILSRYYMQAYTCLPFEAQLRIVYDMSHHIVKILNILAEHRSRKTGQPIERKKIVIAGPVMHEVKRRAAVLEAISSE